jgi:hypothetical protein
MVAMRYAGDHPERVGHLILWPWYRMPDSASQAAMASLERANWDAFTEMFAALAFRGAPGDVSHRYAALMREAMTQQGFAEQWMSAYIPPDKIESFYEHMASRVEVPTLVLQPREQTVERGLSTLMASLPQGVLRTLSGTDQFPYLSSASECAAAIISFVKESPNQPAGFDDHDKTASSGLRIVVAATLARTDKGRADVSELTELVSMIREISASHDASHTWEEGDGVMSAYASSVNALAAAVAIREAWPPQPSAFVLPAPELRIAVHAGEPDGDDDVHLLSTTRITQAAAAKAGNRRILVTNLVRELSAGKSYPFAPAGDLEVPELADPISLYELGL